MNKKLKPKIKITKRTRNITLVIIGILVSLFFYGNHNFENDKQTLLELISKTADGEIKDAYDKMEKIGSFSNPLINIAYQRWKKKIDARFITRKEVIENTSGNKIINDISNIYREYWRIELLKSTKDRTDTTLYNNLTDYLITNQLTNLSKDSLSKTIKNDSELKRIIEDEGFKTRFIYRNGFQDIFIWDKGTTKNYDVVLPKDTINVTVILIEKYHINGYDSYASIGSSQVGGWALKESATLYCNRELYDLASETFMISYLKHESLHFIDLNQYPNLSSTDLEYRAKVIELMYATEKTAYDIIANFTNSADSSYRNHSHPYANYCLIQDMSRLVFNSEYESDSNKWINVPVEKINKAAKQLYELNESKLYKDKNASEII